MSQYIYIYIYIYIHTYTYQILQLYQSVELYNHDMHDIRVSPNESCAPLVLCSVVGVLAWQEVLPCVNIKKENLY